MWIYVQFSIVTADSETRGLSNFLSAVAFCLTQIHNRQKWVVPPGQFVSVNDRNCRVLQNEGSSVHFLHAYLVQAEKFEELCRKFYSRGQNCHEMGLVDSIKFMTLLVLKKWRTTVVWIIMSNRSEIILNFQDVNPTIIEVKNSTQN